MKLDLTTEQRATLIGALVDAFRSAQDFADALYTHAGVRLRDTMSLDAGTKEVVVAAVQQAEGQEWLERLVMAALQERLSSLKLRRIAAALGIRAQGGQVKQPDRVFDLRVLETRDGYSILANDGRGGKAEAQVDPLPREFKRNLPHVQEMLLQGTTATRGMFDGKDRKADLRTLKEMGEDAFRFLMPDQVRTLFIQSRKAAGDAGARTRVQLNLEKAPSLAHVPWELIYETKGYHLCLMEPTPMCRVVVPDVVYERPDPTLHILGMVAKPRAEEVLHSDDVLDYEREQDTIAKGLEPLDDGRVVLGWTTSGTSDELRRMMRRPPGGTAWSVFHFIGHGGVTKGKDGEGYLLLQDAGGVTPLPAERLANILITAQGTPQLVVLNCCSGAKTSPGQPFSSVAAKLVQLGIRAVIAMQFEVSEEAAQLFSKVFYSMIAEGETVQTALTYTRQKMEEKGAEWVTPVLYASGPDFALVELAEGP